MYIYTDLYSGKVGFNDITGFNAIGVFQNVHPALGKTFNNIINISFNKHRDPLSLGSSLQQNEIDHLCLVVQVEQSLAIVPGLSAIY